MKKTKLIIGYALLSVIVFGQQKLDSNNGIVSKTPTQVNLKLPETIQIKDISDNKEDQSNLDKSMPWIAALLIGILSALVNFWAANRLRRSNETNLQRQIESAKDITLTQFKTTLNTKNRQDWIDELRDCISDFLVQCAMINIVMVSTKKSEELKPFFEKMVYNKNKIALLLNTDKKEQKEVLSPIYEIVKISGSPSADYDASKFRAKEEEIIKAARNLFDIHWKKIKDLK